MPPSQSTELNFLCHTAVSQYLSVLHMVMYMCGTSKVALVVKNPPANAGSMRDVGSFPGSGRPPGGGHGNPLQYSCLENPMDRGVWQATVYRVMKNQKQLKGLSTRVYVLMVLSQFIPPPPFPRCCHVSVLSVCISIPALQRRSSVPFFF